MKIIKKLFIIFSFVSCINAQEEGINKTIHLVVPFSAGGPLDITARVLAEQVKDTLGTVIVENKAGAGGNIGVTHISQAKPDGLTIGLATVATHAINPWLFNNLPFDIEAFETINLIAKVPNVLVMQTNKAKQLKIKNLQDLVDYAKNNPNKLSFGSGGIGSAGHLAGELFNRQHGILTTHIAYKGANPAHTALISGEVDFNFDNLSVASANLQAGKVIALATTNKKSLDINKNGNNQTISSWENSFNPQTWWGLIAPKGTPKKIIENYNHEFNKALNNSKTQKIFEKLNVEIQIMSSQEFDNFIKQERLIYKKIISDSNIKLN